MIIRLPITLQVLNVILHCKCTLLNIYMYQTFSFPISCNNYWQYKQCLGKVTNFDLNLNGHRIKSKYLIPFQLIGLSFG